jgi:hypothetical protein
MKADQEYLCDHTCCAKTGISKPDSTKKKVVFVTLGYDYRWEEQDVHGFYQTFVSGSSYGRKSRIVQFEPGGPYYCAYFRSIPLGKDSYTVSKLTPESVRCDKKTNKPCIVIVPNDDTLHCRAVGQEDYEQNRQYTQITLPYSWAQLKKGQC